MYGLVQTYYRPIPVVAEWQQHGLSAAWKGYPLTGEMASQRLLLDNRITDMLRMRPSVPPNAYTYYQVGYVGNAQPQCIVSWPLMQAAAQAQTAQAQQTTAGLAAQLLTRSAPSPSAAFV